MKNKKELKNSGKHKIQVTFKTTEMYIECKEVFKTIMSGKIMESKVQVSNTTGMYTVPLSEKALFLDKIDSKQNL